MQKEGELFGVEWEEKKKEEKEKKEDGGVARRRKYLLMRIAGKQKGSGG